MGSDLFSRETLVHTEKHNSKSTPLLSTGTSLVNNSNVLSRELAQIQSQKQGEPPWQEHPLLFLLPTQVLCALGRASTMKDEGTNEYLHTGSLMTTCYSFQGCLHFKREQRV